MSYIYSIEGISRKEREREKFYVINVKYKEIPQGKKRGGGGGKK